MLGMPGGRPSKYTKALATRVLRHIEEGKSLRQIQKLSGMPSVSTILKWRRENEEFSKLYDEAKLDMMEVMADQIMEISDEENPDDTARAKLRVDTRKWLMARLANRRYGDKIEQNVTGNTTIRVVTGFNNSID